ncbi:MAG: hypothetical protein GTO02_04785, partial [Candidatus Dadabacteria bacterium]|nr:hypothetical protein [Candidatus Dadabacteria bacterium]
KGSELNLVLKSGKLKDTDIDNLARQVAAFHESINLAKPTDEFGSIESIKKAVLDNINRIRPVI